MKNGSGVLLTQWPGMISLRHSREIPITVFILNTENMYVYVFILR